VARQIEAYLRSNNRALEFRVDADTGRTVISVRDSETGELIRQIPGDEVLRIAQAMKELTSLLHETA
jgi:flagellar protein FlaG